jgi:hypothetical protein
MCVVGKCTMGWEDCDNNPANGCEHDVTGDFKNCGACNNVCPANSNCVNGTCTPEYLPVGPQQNVPVANLTGWKLCYSDTYNVNMQMAVPAIQAACSQAKLLLACRTNGNATTTLLAWGLRTDVLFDTGAAPNQGHTAGPVVWYFDPNYSWGFATAGDQLALGQCDTNAGADRLCWHTINGVGGYRCGTNIALNGNNGWDRLIYQAP